MPKTVSKTEVLKKRYEANAKRESVCQLWKPDPVRVALLSATRIRPGTTRHLSASSYAPSFESLNDTGPSVWCSDSAI